MTEIVTDLDPLRILLYYRGMKVYKLGEDILRVKATPLTEVTDETRVLIDDMFATMHEKNGIGIAGPQVGIDKRIFVIELDDEVKHVFINPQITATSEETSMYEEGCLSIPGVYESIERPVKVTVQALNRDGKLFTLDADGLLARAIQHETDHLDGILFIDRGDPEFRAKTIENFEKKLQRKRQKDAEKKVKAERLARKLAAKEGKTV